MTTLLITPNPDRKTAKFKGTIAAGEHVAVTIKDGAEWDEEGLTLRVIDFTTMRTLAVFPRPAEVLEDGEEPDAWETTQSGDLTCTLNLNTVRMVNAARHMIHVPVLFVLGNSDEDSRTLYVRDRYEVELWPERIGDDVPYDLDKWPKQIDEWTDQMEAWARQMQAFDAALTAEAEARASGDAPLSGQVINTNTANALRQAVKTIGAALGATMRVLAVCAALPLLGATVQTAPLGGLDLDQNPSVVTNVTFEGLLTEHQDISGKADKTNTYTKAETGAAITNATPGIVSNTVTKAFVEGLGIASEETDPTVSLVNITDGSKRLTVKGASATIDNVYFNNWQGNRWTRIFINGEWADFPHTASEIGATTPADIPPIVSNVVTKTYVEGLGISSEETDPVWSADKSNYATLYYANSAASNAVTPVSNKVEETSAIVNTWETYWGGTNVVMEVTNYYGNTTGTLPRLRIREYRDGAWTNVWDEVDKFNVCKAEILHDVAQSNETERAVASTNYAPIAWGRVTDKGTPNPETNTTYMTSPQTYFGGGTEYQRIAVGSGAVCVLVDKGALAHTAGEPGTFRFQDDGGTNYFGFAKSDSYTIGCRTDGIVVGTGNLITLRYDVIMAGTDVPVVYWKESLSGTTPWAQLNNVDGTAASGAPHTVTWLQEGGSYYANINCGSSPSGFFKAETSVAGDVVFETNMKARLGGGVECTNTATHAVGVIRPSYNGSTVTWTWSAR